jgi:MFS family permease
MMILAFSTTFFIHNLPEEVGCTPDNITMSAEQIAESRRLQAESQKHSSLTMWQLLRMRDVWLLSLITGGMYIMVVGVQSQVITRLMSFGHDQNTAILYWTIAAIIGLPCGYGWGWLGQKLGIRRSYIIYTVWWVVAIIMNIFSQYNVCFWISLMMIGISLGGSSNYATAIIAEKFRRATFIKAYRVIAPIQGILRCCSFSILAFGLTYLGGYTGAYAIFAAIGVVTLILIFLVNLTPVEMTVASGHGESV